MNKALFILISGTMFFIYCHNAQRKPFKRVAKGLVEKKMAKLSRTFKKESDHKGRSKMIVNMIFGLKNKINPKIKNQFEKLNLLHLFTPSGLHFSSLFIFLSPLFLKTKKYSKYLPKALTIIICLFPFALLKYYSLKRIALMKIFSILFNRKLSIYSLFLLTFFLDFTLGSFSLSPLSFSYSYIFLGSLLSFGKFNIKVIVSLLTSQFIIALFFATQVNILGSLIGFFITSIFTLTFPLLIFLYALYPLIGTHPVGFLMSLFLKLVELGFHIAKNFPDLSIPFSTILISMAYLSSFSSKTKKYLFILLIAMA